MCDFIWVKLAVYKNIVFTRFFGVIAFDPKSYRNIYEPKYICDQNWMKFSSLVCEIW